MMSELGSRTSSGTRVQLLCRPGDGSVWVTVSDTKAGQTFELAVH